MKKIILLLILSTTLLGCKKETSNITISTVTTKKNEPRNEVVISTHDTISTFNTNLFLDDMQDKPDLLYLGQKEQQSSIVIPTDNTIKIRGGNPWLSLTYKLELHRGDSLFIAIDKIPIQSTKNVEFPIFEISNSDRRWSELNFENLLYKENLKKGGITIDTTSTYTKATWDSEKMFDNAIQLLNRLKAADSISNEFYNTTSLTKKIVLATSKVRKAKIQQQDLTIADLEIPLNSKELLRHNEYLMFLRTVIQYTYFKGKKRLSNSEQFDYINEQETFLNHDTKLAVLDSYLKSIYFIEKNNFKPYLKKFSSINTNETLKNKWDAIAVQQELNQKKLNDTNRSIGILTNLVNDNELTFEEVLAMHKGSITLVDFWASWCAPCRKEMPHLKQLKAQFKDTELHVIEISIDNDYAAWERASKLEGISKETSNYIISNWEKSNLYKNYDIKTIPRYLLFDKNGKIINANAPRPSKKELAELIKKHL